MLPEIEIIVEHFKSCFEGHEFERMTWDKGPMKELIPEFEVVRFSPGPKCEQWAYCSVGASKIEHDESGRYEFIVLSPFETERMVEMLAMLTYYHSQNGLRYADTVPIGEPWVEGSVCENWLISLPYLFDQKIEVVPDIQAHVAWLLPISNAEREYIAENGLEALEQQFDQAKLKYWDVNRTSVV